MTLDTMDIPFSEEEAVKSGTFISGMPGSGKTNLAKHLVKRLLAKNIRIFVFDPSEAWSIEGPIKRIQTVDRANLDYPIPVESTVFDIKTLYVSEQQTLVQNFCKELFMEHVFTERRSRIPTIVVFEEAQIYVPEGQMRAKVAEEIKRLVTLGRNFTLRIVVMTQFAANVDKLLVKTCGQKYMGFTDEPNDWNYLKNWVTDKEELADLEQGEFLYRFKSTKTRIKVTEFRDRGMPIIVQPSFLNVVNVPLVNRKERIRIWSHGAIVGFLLGIAVTFFALILWIYA